MVSREAYRTHKGRSSGGGGGGGVGFKLFFLLVAFLFNNVLKRDLFRFIKLEGTFSRLNRVQSTNLTYLNKGLANFPIPLL